VLQLGTVSGDIVLESSWIRPVLILGAVVILIVLNVLEFRGKRRQDRSNLAALESDDRPEIWLARKQYLQTQNIEQVMHILNTVLIAILIAVLTA
jgi:hypothetical protein